MKMKILLSCTFYRCRCRLKAVEGFEELEEKLAVLLR